MTLGRCWLAVCLALAFAGVAAAAPRLECRAERVGDRALVSVAVADLLDPDLRRLVRLGLAGRLRLEASLHRRRAFWFDALEVREARELTIGWSDERGQMHLDGEPAALEPLMLPLLPLRPAGGRLSPAEHHVELELRLEVVTASSLGEVARWLVGGRREVVPGALLGALASDLARTARGRCTIPALARQ